MAFCQDQAKVAWTNWNRFWFTPERHETLAVIRICSGLMIFYTHLVWSSDLLGFFGVDGRIPPEAMAEFHYSQFYNTSAFGWSHWLWFDSPTILWTIHILGLVITLLFAFGCATRVTSILTFLLTISYIHRVPGALFGLDQINSFLVMYVMIGDAGRAYSVDRWLAGRSGKTVPDRSVLTNIALRLIQLHMCIVYLFAALGKLQGETWWAGQAMWLSLANYEYQTLDMLWLGQHPLLINLLTHITLLWEASYIALIWPKWSRPFMLLVAIPLHLGIALCMGMITFGLIMLVGNMAFVPPAFTAACVAGLTGWWGRAGEGHPA
ncbi:MAG: HTTM domain-containing protein [Planctomycetota bacterium]